MTRRRRWIIVLGGLATVLVATALVLREASFGGRLPPEVRSRMPAHWRTPWFAASDVSRAIEGLYSPDHATRAAGASALVDLGPRAEPAVPYLVAALADVPPPPPPDAGVPILSRPPLWDRIKEYVFGKRPEPPAGAPDEYASQYAPVALAEVGPPAVDPLIAALKDPMPAVRAGAAAALGDIGQERAVDALAAAPWPKTRDYNVHEACPEAWALATIGGRGIDILIERLHDKDAATRTMAAAALGCCRGECPRVVEALAAATADPDGNVARAATVSLGSLRDEHATQALIAALDSTKFTEVRRYAVLGLQAHPDTKAVDALLGVLTKGDPRDPGAAAEALGWIGDPRATEPLIDWLGRAPAGQRWETARALGEFRDRRAVMPLVAVIEGPRDWAGNDQSDAAIALGKIGDDRAVPALIRALEGQDRLLAVEAAEALGRIGDARAVPALLKALENNDPRVSQAGAQAIGRIGDARAADPLLAAVRGDNPQLRAAAARAIGRLHDPRAYEPLVKMLEGSVFVDAEPVHAAADGLGFLGDPRAAEPIMAFINAFDISSMTAMELRDYSGPTLIGKSKIEMPVADGLTLPALALVRLGDPRGLDVFFWATPQTTWSTLHLDDPLVLGPAGIKVFTEALTDARPQVQHAAAVALVAEGSPEAVAAVVAAYPRLPTGTRLLLLPELARRTRCPDVTAALAGIMRTDRDRFVRMAAAEELGARGDPAAAEALRRAAADDPLRCVRKAAALELEALLRRNPPDAVPPRWQTHHDLTHP